MGRLRPEERSSEYLHSKVTDFFYRKGQTSLNKWQINQIVRNALSNRVALTHDDINTLEAEIRRKETGLPGSKMSPVSSSQIKLRNNIDIKMSGQMPKVKNGGSSPLAANAQRFVHHKQMSINDMSMSNQMVSNSGTINSSILQEFNQRQNGGGASSLNASANMPIAKMAAQQTHIQSKNRLQSLETQQQ